MRKVAAGAQGCRRTLHRRTANSMISLRSIAMRRRARWITPPWRAASQSGWLRRSGGSAGTPASSRT